MVTAIEVIVNSNFIVSFDVTLLIVKNHASLDNLDYAHSGHTGFASSADLAGKQDKLTAGSGISISGSTISTTTKVDVLETGKLVKKLYSEMSSYKIIFCYGYRDALDAPNQFMFAFMPDQLQVNGEDLQFLTMAGSNNWQYPVKIKRHSDGYVYWWSAYDYSGNTTFFVTKVVGVK